MEKSANLIIGNDQMTECMVIYNLDNVPEDGYLEQGVVTSIHSGHAAGIKYRENTVFGDVILIGGDTSYLVSYPSGKVLWSTTQAGNNTHSVEILPGGNLVFANSTGCDIRLFYTSALLNGDEQTAGTYSSYPFEETHGVLWDPVYERLWAFGDVALSSYRLIGDGADQRLELDKVYPIAAYGNAGHDLSPDLTDSRYLYCSPRFGVLRFDKETGTFDPSVLEGTYLQTVHLKSFSQATDGSFVFTVPNRTYARRTLEGWWKRSWCTDHIGVLRRLPDGTFQETRYYAENSAYYKSRAFCGRYL